MAGDTDDLGGAGTHAGRDALVAGRDLTVNYMLRGMPGAVARSTYMQQVRRIAPPDPPGLIGREDELAELARFCLDPHRGPYVWWRADAWAGKSALLSTFVLRPPREVADEVQIVSFFITARLASQDTREAFTEVLLEQLADLTGQELPAALPEARRDAYLLDLLEQAATICKDAGKRLVLVVDGLDEDRGVTAGPNAHSIAGLLPAEPPAGMRVITAGRPNPPIPDDVDSWHPLRDPGIVRQLQASPHARDVARLGKHELQRLLRGGTAGQDLLGLLTAARGGLSGPELEELTGTPLWEIEQILDTVAGRTFTRRVSRWAGETGPEVYLLGHEELQAAAASYLGLERLASYYNRLHAWAVGYREKGWPPGTPEYLLSSYFRLLVSLGDLPRLIAIASDISRHDRMLELTGGDAAALGEIRTVLDLIADQGTPDLASAFRLASHRDQLAERNAGIPVALPAVWAALGQIARALALAVSITDLVQQAQALTRVAEVLAEAGLYQQAHEVARSIAAVEQQAEALARVAGVLAAAGEHEQAAATAARAEEVAGSIAGTDRQAEALARVAGVLAAAGQHEQAAATAARAEEVARSITSDYRREEALAQAAGVLAEAGQYRQAEAVARSIAGPFLQEQALKRIAGVLAEAGQHQQAEDVARSITSEYRREQALSEIVEGLARAGHYQLAEKVARSITSERSRQEALARVGEGLAKAGHYGKASEIARSITSEYSQGTLARIIEALADAGDYESAEDLVRFMTSPHLRAHTLMRVGQYKKAKEVARSITSPDVQAQALALVAEGLVKAGQHEQAAAAAAQAEEVARSITSPEMQAQALANFAAILAEAGQYQQAEEMLRSIADPNLLAKVAATLTQSGHYRQAEEVARSIASPGLQALALGRVADALAEAGLNRRAEELARSIPNPYLQALALARVTQRQSGPGDYQLASITYRLGAQSAELEIQSVIFRHELRTRAGAQDYRLFPADDRSAARGNCEHRQSSYERPTVRLHSSSTACRRFRSLGIAQVAQEVRTTSKSTATARWRPAELTIPPRDSDHARNRQPQTPALRLHAHAAVPPTRRMPGDG